MKKILGILTMALLLLSVMPVVFAEGDDTSGGVGIVVGSDHVPRVCTDSTERSWNPNDQTYYTAELYGMEKWNDYGDSYYDVSVRGNYVFTGETVDYYVIVEDEDGEDTIEDVILLKDDAGVGSCFEKTARFSPGQRLLDFDCGNLEWNPDTMRLYRCQLVVQGAWTNSAGASDIQISASDEDGNEALSTWTDRLNINPPLSVTLAGTIDFGNAEEGETVTSNTVYLNNIGSNGVVMDMYIASDDYFTDPSNPTAICGVGNGIPYDAFSYYATKGSVDSGDNNNAFRGLGESYGCASAADEYTEMPSHSGEITDMCRIINHLKESSLLMQGQSMSLTFQLDVPAPCEGSFTDGSFHFEGRVV